MRATNATDRGLRANARAILIANDRGSFIAPGPHQYPCQWNWDAALITIGLAHINPQRGRHEVLQLLRGQWDDGMVPHVVFWDEANGYFPGPGVWKTREQSGAPAIPVTGITQPPVLASAVRILHERDPDPAFLERVVPALERWHRWLDAERRRQGGLVAILHPWESGTDNSPRFDEALGRVSQSHHTTLERRDTRHVPSEQRPTTGDYHRYLGLLESLRDAEYRPEPETAPFAYGDVGFTSILARAEWDLVHLWSQLGDRGLEATRRHESLSRALMSSWDDQTQRFIDQDLRTGRSQRNSADCSATLLPLYAGVADDDRATALARLLWDPSGFGPADEYPWAVTGVAKSNPAFDPLRYWRGPVWINMNWFLVRGLQSVGLNEDAQRLSRHTLDLVARHGRGMFEYYDPRTGDGLGSSDFSWTAALILDLLERP